MINGVEKYKYAFISADYRLAPQVGVQDIFQDVRDCIGFVRTELAQRIRRDAVDPQRLAVAGSSAGGYLALLAGLYIEPKPRVVLCMYPITDPLGKFFTTSQQADRVDYEMVAEYLDKQAEAVANNAPGPRDRMYNLMLEKANLAELLQVEGDEFRIAKNIDKHGLPPTYIVHPDGDVDVGIDQTDEVVGIMFGLGLHVKYDRLRGLGHFFDHAEGVGLEEMYAFFQEHS